MQQTHDSSSRGDEKLDWILCHSSSRLRALRSTICMLFLALVEDVKRRTRNLSVFQNFLRFPHTAAIALLLPSKYLNWKIAREFVKGFHAFSRRCHTTLIRLQQSLRVDFHWVFLSLSSHEANTHWRKTNVLAANNALPPIELESKSTCVFSVKS